MRRISRLFFRLVSFLIGGVVLVIIFNTLRFSSRQVPVSPIEAVEIDDEVLQRLSSAVQIPTISYENFSDPAPFYELDTFISEAFPLVDSFLIKEKINWSTLYKWEGKNARLAPILLIAHMDVVPVADSSAWQVPPFSGIIQDDSVWGRGALDDKNSLMGLLEAVEMLLKEGYYPERSVYLAFGHDEEIGGLEGAQAIAEYFHEQGIRFEYVLDEGLVVLENALAMLEPPVAMIGVAEKGYVSLHLTVKMPGGHTMMPPPETAVSVLSSAIEKLQHHPFPAKVNGATKQLFNYIGPEMSPLYKVLFANLWLTKGVLTRQLSQDPPANATIRTTVAPTIISGGIKDNVLPAQAKATVNFRILPGETTASVKAYVKELIDDERIEISEVNAAFAKDPSPVSPTDAFGFTVIQRTIQEIFPAVIVAPGLVIAGTDSRHYASVTENIYRFMPVRINKAELSRIHGANERISAVNYKQMIRFYRQLIINSCK